MAASQIPDRGSSGDRSRPTRCGEWAGVAYVVATNPDTFDAAQFTEYLRSRLASYKVPKQLVVTSQYHTGTEFPLPIVDLQLRLVALGIGLCGSGHLRRSRRPPALSGPTACRISLSLFEIMNRRRRPHCGNGHRHKYLGWPSRVP